MKKLTILSLFLLLQVSIFGQHGWRQGEMEIRIEIKNPSQAKLLTSLHLNGDIYPAGYALFYVIPSELDKIRELGLDFQITKADLNDYYKDFWKNRDAYHSADEIYQIMNSLALGYPAICSKHLFGTSVEGRELAALKISDNVNIDEAEPELMFDGGIHGDEIGGAENLIRFARQLCESYGTDSVITDLINNREIWIYVMVNPDGRVNMSRYNSFGIDLNRDWGYMWDEWGGSPGYFSQVETRAIRSCMDQNQFVTEIAYHSGTEFLSYPWSYRPDACPDYFQMDHLAQIYSSVSGYANLAYGQGYSGMYAINGSSKDSHYGIMGSIGWTIEISDNKQPPASQIQQYYDYNYPAMIAIIENAGYGISGTVTDAVTGAAIPAIIFVNDYFPSYTDPEIGDYHKYILQGNYVVTAVANGYEPLSQNVSVPDNTSNTILNFQLQAADNHYAYKVEACQIPNNNYGDEGYTPASLGAPDSVYYSLGKNGWIILDMQDTIPDGPGEEIKVYEGDTTTEGYTCYAGMSVDGPWTNLGNGMGTSSFDFSGSGLQQARFIRIKDDGDGSGSGNDIGFDLDAVQRLDQPPVIYLQADAGIDDAAGNNNGRIDPGESFNLVVTLRNLGGLTAQSTLANLNYDSAFFTVENADVSFGDIAYSGSSQASIPMVCNSSVSYEEILQMVLNVSANGGDYLQSIPLNFTSGILMEDWESNNFQKFDWTTSGDMPWLISPVNPFEGNYSAVSGNIADNQSSFLQISLDVIAYDDISFYRRVSSQYAADFLKFYIDNILIDQWSGNLDWQYVKYEVEPGMHTFKWIYIKNANISFGSDGAWLDNIVLPSSNLDGSLSVIANAAPHEFCGAGGSQLGAYTVGGSGNISYYWSPETGLDDPNSAFPLATVQESTEYTLNIYNGLNNASSAVSVTVHPIPEPVIEQQGDSLISDIPDGNQWFGTNGLIEGATDQVYYPEIEDTYYTIVNSQYGCISEPSNPINFLFNGLQENTAANEITVFPNPARKYLSILLHKNYSYQLKINIYDFFGRSIYSEEIVQDIDGSPTIIGVEKLQKGIYFLCIS